MEAAPRGSEDEYIARERASERKHELINGVILATAGASARQWIFTTYQGEAAVASLPALGCELPLAEVYDKLDLLPPAAAAR